MPDRRRTGVATARWFPAPTISRDARGDAKINGVQNNVNV